LIRSIGTGSDGCGLSGAARLDLARRILIRRPGTLASGEAAGASADGGDRRWARRRQTLTRALVPGLARGRHLPAARGAAKPTGAARAAATRWSGGTTRRRGKEDPARSLGRRGSRDRQRTAPVRSSPPGAALGQLHVDATAAETRNQRRLRKTRVRVPAVLGAWRLGHGWRRSWGGGRL
jgi:hypothetical protein